MAEFSLNDLARLIEQRANAPADKSYTRSLLQAGPAHVARKFGEEAVEAIVAAVSGDSDGLRNEAADVLYHLLVMLQSRGVALDGVLAELARRTARSGLEEKAARQANG